MISQLSPMLLPVRGSATPGNSGASSLNEKPFSSAPMRAPAVFAMFMFNRRRRNALLCTIGTSEVVSEPPPMPASIWPSAILFATVMTVSSEVPQARCMVMPGVYGDRPELSAASRPMFQSLLCLSTAPMATSPSCTPCRPNFSTTAPTALIDRPRLPTS